MQQICYSGHTCKCANTCISKWIRSDHIQIQKLFVRRRDSLQNAERVFFLRLGPMQGTRRLRGAVDPESVLGAHSANLWTVRYFFPYVTLVKNKIYDVIHFSICFLRWPPYTVKEFICGHDCEPYHAPWYARFLSLKSIYQMRIICLKWSIISYISYMY